MDWRKCADPCNCLTQFRGQPEHNAARVGAAAASRARVKSCCVPRKKAAAVTACQQDNLPSRCRGERSDADLSVAPRSREALSLFVDEMRALREQRGWSQAGLAQSASYSALLIAMVETYQRAPTRGLARALDRAFATPGYAEDAESGDWTFGTFGRLWYKLRTVSFPASFRPFAEREEEATALRTFEHSLMPGLLQTQDYARRPGHQARRDRRRHRGGRSGPHRAAVDPDPRHPAAAAAVGPAGRGHPVPPRRSRPGHAGPARPPDGHVPSAERDHSGRAVRGGRAQWAAGRVYSRGPARRANTLPKAASRDLIAKVARERWTA
jgi:ribosome-binding protein aMBF1 (putative translation factor)